MFDRMKRARGLTVEGALTRSVRSVAWHLPICVTEADPSSAPTSLCKHGGAAAVAASSPHRTIDGKRAGNGFDEVISHS